MEIVSLSLLKLHLRLEEDETEQDELLQKYINGAAELVERSINCTFPRLVKLYGKLPDSLAIAVMQIAAHWYRHPEAAEQATLSMCPAATVAVVNKFKKRLPNA